MSDYELTERDKKRFWSKVKKTDTCWLWTGSVDIGGYGQFMVQREKRSRHFKASRASYLMAKGSCSGLKVLHKCDTPACVNPEHLVLGTQTDNLRAAALRKRVPQYKLTREDQPKILELRGLGMTYAEIAPQFNVSEETIGDVVRGRTWSWDPASVA